MSHDNLDDEQFALAKIGEDFAFYGAFGPELQNKHEVITFAIRKWWETRLLRYELAEKVENKKNSMSVRMVACRMLFKIIASWVKLQNATHAAEYDELVHRSFWEIDPYLVDLIAAGKARHFFQAMMFTDRWLAKSLSVHQWLPIEVVDSILTLATQNREAEKVDYWKL